MSEEDVSSIANGSAEQAISPRHQEHPHAELEGMSMVEFYQKLIKRFRVLRFLTPQQKEHFQLELVKLLVDENQQVDINNYQILTKDGLEAFVLEILGLVLKETKPKSSESVLNRDLQDIERLIGERMANLGKRQKAVTEKQTKLRSLENSLHETIKHRAQALQKEIIETMGRKEDKLTKRLNTRTRELKLKADILKDRMAEMEQLSEQMQKINAQERSLKQRLKTLERREECLKKKQAECIKTELQVSKHIEEAAQSKQKIKDLERKLAELNNTLSERSRLIASRDQQLAKLKGIHSQLSEKVDSLEQALQLSKQALKQKTKAKQSPAKLLEELNISEIVHHEQSFVSTVPPTEQPTTVNYEPYLRVIEELLAATKQEHFSKSFKESLLLVFQQNLTVSTPRIQKQILKWVVHEKEAVGSFASVPQPPMSFHCSLIFLFGAPVTSNTTAILDSLDLQQDSEKEELIFSGYLSRIIQQIGMKHLPNQPLSCSIVSLMLRSIEQSSFYDRIIQELALLPYLEYMQTLFEKYEMEEEIIDNLSVLLSRCCISSGCIKLRPTFLQSLKRKLKVIPNDLPRRNLLSVLDYQSR